MCSSFRGHEAKAGTLAATAKAVAALRVGDEPDLADAQARLAALKSQLGEDKSAYRSAISNAGMLLDAAEKEFPEEPKRAAEHAKQLFGHRRYLLIHPRHILRC